MNDRQIPLVLGLVRDLMRENPDQAGKWWLSDENMRDVAAKLGLDAVPYLGEMTLEEATVKIRTGFNSLVGAEPLHPAEGMVGRPVEPLFDKKGSRLIVKLKTKDF